MLRAATVGNWPVPISTWSGPSSISIACRESGMGSFQLSFTLRTGRNLSDRSGVGNASASSGNLRPRQNDPIGGVLVRDKAVSTDASIGKLVGLHFRISQLSTAIFRT